MAKRNYRKEYDEYHGSLTQKRNRAKRNAVRRKLLPKGDPREVDHIKPLSKGGTNGAANVRIVSRTTNRKKHDA